MKGFNDEIPHRGALFHVQTQDVGFHVQYIESLIYKSGKLLSSRKTFYTPFLGTPNLSEKIQHMMETQHQTILREIREGKFDHFLSPEEKT